MSAYDETAETLYRAPFAEFVAERKRLAAELKAAGDKSAAERLAKLARPPVSAWAVNQLWWHERKSFEALIDAAANVKLGDREAGKRHREALAKLREQAAELLQAAGNAATEPTLRRIATTLSAVAASGSFAPDAPGALTSDRDPPGFEALSFGAAAPATPQKATKPTEDAAATRAAEAAQRRAEEEERKRRLAERQRLSDALRGAQKQRDARQRDVSRLREELETAEQDLKKSQDLLAEIETELASL